MASFLFLNLVQAASVVPKQLAFIQTAVNEGLSLNQIQSALRIQGLGMRRTDIAHLRSLVAEKNIPHSVQVKAIGLNRRVQRETFRESVRVLRRPYSYHVGGTVFNKNTNEEEELNLWIGRRTDQDTIAQIKQLAMEEFGKRPSLKVTSLFVDAAVRSMVIE